MLDGVATDAVGQVALFTTGDPGPAPDSALPSVENSEEPVLSLPEGSDVDRLTVMAGATLSLSLPNVDSLRMTGRTFIAMHARS
ncbi:hypothetical protein SAMN03159474_04364 [Pseudomonas sp. NFACC08-1]|nr:hypothetical protein SAMN03159474_04364 [Pseudomonas sp. NFACC08-1]